MGDGAKTRPEGKGGLRSRAWFDNPDNPDMTALYLERYLNYGFSIDELQSGRPIIGIAQTGSDLTPCNRHHLELAKRVRDGIRDAGGIATTTDSGSDDARAQRKADHFHRFVVLRRDRSFGAVGVPVSRADLLRRSVAVARAARRRAELRLTSSSADGERMPADERVRRVTGIRASHVTARARVRDGTVRAAVQLDGGARTAADEQARL